MSKSNNAQFLEMLETWSQPVAIRQGEKFVFVNQALADLYGYESVEAVLALGSSSVILAEGERERLARYRAARDKGEAAPACYELQLVRKDGSLWWAENRVREMLWNAEPAVMVAVSDVTERRRSEEALRASEARFKDFAESAAQWFWETDARHRFVYHSRGINPVDVILDRTRHELRMAEDADDAMWLAHLADLEAWRPFRNFEYSRYDEHGDVHFVSISGKPIFGDDGTFLGYRGIGSDVTERKRAEQALIASETRAAESHALLVDAIESLSEGFALLDPDDRLMMTNRQFLKHYKSVSHLYVPGTSYEDIAAGVAASGLIPEAQGQEDDWVRKRIERHRQPSGPFELQLGPGRWLLVDESKTSNGSTVSVFTDITELKRAESDLRVLNRDLEGRVEQRTRALSHELREREQAQLSLRHSEERLRVVMDSTVDGIIVIDEDGVIETFSRSASEIFGYAPDEIIGRNIDLLMPEPDRSRHAGYMRRYLAGGESHIIGIGREIKAQRKDGTIIPIEIGVSEVTMGDERFFTGTVRDISERKRVEEELLLAWKAADSANQAKSEFLSSMSHELRTPLNGIMGFAQLLKEYSDQPLTEEQRTSVQQILDSGRHLLGLVNEILDLSKIEAGHMDLSLEPTDIVATLGESVSLVQPLADSRRISIAFDLGELEVVPKTLVRVDPNRLKQVLLNVLSNAVKYNRDGGAVTIAAAAASSGMLRIAISDTGPGIPHEQYDEVFRPFSRLGMEASKIEGTGIGLAISRQLIESMDGRLEFESSLGEGSRFWLEIPLA